MILGDQSSADLANEIAQELSAELGVSLQQAQAAVGRRHGRRAGRHRPLRAGRAGRCQPAAEFREQMGGHGEWPAECTSTTQAARRGMRSALGFMAVQGVISTSGQRRSSAL